METSRERVLPSSYNYSNSKPKKGKRHNKMQRFRKLY
jgi:hypothetical protein